MQSETIGELSQERLKELLHYDPRTGVFTRNISPGNQVVKGDKAGWIADGRYIKISVQNTTYPAHRLAWLYVYGYLPENSIDHIDRDKQNNKITNLREASRQCNMRNSGLGSHNTSGIKGVSYSKKNRKWNAYITINRKRIHLGYYKSKYLAANARYEAEQKHNFTDCDTYSSAMLFIKMNKEDN